MTSIDKIKSILNEINERVDHEIIEDEVITALTRALEVAVDALSNTFPGEYGKDIKNHNDDYLNKIAEILEVKP